jgi:protein tyrosine phosphatase
MLKKLNDQQSLNIPSFLKHIRQQRNNLVQTEEQFIFIYDVLLEVVELLSIGYKNLELNKQNLDSIIQMLDYYDQNSNLTRIEKQFQLILSSTYNYRLLPFNSGRVLVKQTGEGYINASYIHVSI